MKIAGVVILYYPDEEVNENIRSYLPHVGQLYIVDNSEKSQVEKLSDDIVSSNKVQYLTDGTNHGIAESLNKVCNLAITAGYEWLLTMDQDSKFDNNSLTEYLHSVEAFTGREKIAQFGVEHYRPNLALASAAGWKYVNMLITSGSLVNLEHFSKVGGFDENLFIDEVDSEYCFRSILAGYKVVLFEKILLNHNLGTVGQYRSLKSGSKTPRALHSPIRVYYMVRNHLYVYNRYREDFLSDLKYSRSALLNRIKNNLLYGKRRIEIIRFLIRAVKDYQRNRMGKMLTK